MRVNPRRKQIVNFGCVFFVTKPVDYGFCGNLAHVFKLNKLLFCGFFKIFKAFKRFYKVLCGNFAYPAYSQSKYKSFGGNALAFSIAPNILLIFLALKPSNPPKSSAV